MFIILLLSLNRHWALRLFHLTLTEKFSYNHYNQAKVYLIIYHTVKSHKKSLIN